MTIKQMNKIFNDTAYVRTGGSEEERRTAEYIKRLLLDYGLEATVEPFEVDMADIHSAKLEIDGREIPCKGYLLCGSGTVEAPLCYLTSDDRLSLRECKGKIVLFDGYLGYWKYRDLFESGAVGFISYDGNANYADKDIDQRELRSYVSKGDKLLGVNINAKDAIAIVKAKSKTAKITVSQTEYKGQSQNVVLDIKGRSEKTVVLTAHYDSTSLSKGAYDNMSGSVGLISLAEKFAKKTPNHSLKFIWCGSEERGLLGSKAFCKNEEALTNIELCVNLDMIGSIMGHFIACCTSEKELVGYIRYMGDEHGFQIKPYQDVYSSDSTPFSDKGVPSVSFARCAPPSTATIHNSYDTKAVMSMEQMVKDIEFIYEFVRRMAEARLCPVSREIPDEMKTKLDEYLCRKRKPKS